MSDLSNLSALLATHSAAERDLETLRSFVASGGEHRLTFNVEHKDDETRATVERLLGSLVNKHQFLVVIDNRQQFEVNQAHKAIMDAALSMSLADGMKEAAE